MNIKFNKKIFRDSRKIIGLIIIGVFLSVSLFIFNIWTISQINKTSNILSSSQFKLVKSEVQYATYLTIQTQLVSKNRPLIKHLALFRRNHKHIQDLYSPIIFLYSNLDKHSYITRTSPGFKNMNYSFRELNIAYVRLIFEVEKHLNLLKNKPKSVDRHLKNTLYPKLNDLIKNQEEWTKNLDLKNLEISKKIKSRQGWLMTLIAGSICVQVLLFFILFSLKELNNTLKDKDYQMKVNMMAVSSKIITAQETERKEISSLVHDELGHLLASANLQIHCVKETERHLSEHGKKGLEKTKNLINESNQILKSLLKTLRPTYLEQYGFTYAIELLLEKALKNSFISCKKKIAISSPDKLTNIVKNAAYRIIKEGLTNIIKHADATHIKLDLKDTDGHLIIRLYDNGKGVVPSALHKSDGYGILGIRERVETLKGTVQILTSKGNHGLLLKVTLPLTHHEQALSHYDC
jgi:signal transduction histidine kinase